MSTNMNFLASPALIPEKYDALQKKMKFQKMATNIDEEKSSKCVGV